IAPFLEEAKRQLHEEADYEREAAQLAGFAAHLSEDPDFTVPTPAPEFTTRDVLAMSFVKGIPVERMAEAPQAERDRIVRLLLSLMLRELFDFGLVQTDPNFANYRYDPETRRIVLLDFGAARAYAPALAERYRRCLSLGVTGEREGQREAAILAGFISAETAAHHQDAVLDLMAIAAAPFRSASPTDFGTDRTASQLRDQGYDLAMDRAFADIVPMDTLYLQRKVAGMYLLANRLGARVDLAALIAPYLDEAVRNEKRASLG
ncbi:MAG: AarF/UbiB family protein, partial [Pseudomonadota bacterium]